MNAAITYASDGNSGAWPFEVVSVGIVAQCVQPVHAGQIEPMGHGGMHGDPRSASVT